MLTKEFGRLLGSLDGLSLSQLRRVIARVSELDERREVQDLTDRRIDVLGGCPHCSHHEFARWGRTGAGEQRYHCAGCGKTFTKPHWHPVSEGARQVEAA